MVTTSQADAIHSARGNSAWAALDNTAKLQALAKAGDFITAYYPLKAGVEASDERLVLATALLALDLQTSPIALRAQQGLKIEEKTLDKLTIKKGYADAPTDPFPLVTAILAPLTAKADASGISFGVIR